MSSPDDFVPLANSVRSDLVESVHTGAVVILASDRTLDFSIGNPDAVIYGRSSNKPLQADAMLAHGAVLTQPQLALACASHSGAQAHLDVVLSTLESVGLGQLSLQNTPDLPLDKSEALRWVAEGGTPSSLTQNCSGKHAAMLATCVANGWDVATYLETNHPVQQIINERVADLTDGLFHVGIDGCGAPTHATTLRGLATGFAKLANQRGPVWEAMTQNPELVGGLGRSVTELMQAVPGLMAKDGADGVFVGALPDGPAVAVKIGDGASRASGAVFARGLQLAGVLGDDVDVSSFSDPVLGHGAPVGAIVPTFSRSS